MAQPRHLNHAPIVEAIIDVRATAPVSFQVADILAKKNEIGLNNKTEEMRQMTMGWFFEPTGTKPPQQNVKDGGILGYRFLSEDGLHVLQMRKDGFSFSRLQPYDSWETFFAEASRLWNLYANMVHPEDISRIAVRYINRLFIPLHQEGKGLRTFLTAFPVLPPDVPPYVSQWMTRVLIHDPNVGTQAFLTQVAEPPQTDKISVLLDIDAFSVAPLPLDAEQLLPRFLPLHDLKNRLFFQSFTEEGIKLFE